MVNKVGADDESVVYDLYSSIPPAPAGIRGVSLVEEGRTDEIPGVDLPDVAVVNKPTGVDIGGPQAVPPQDAVFDDAIFDTALDDGLDQEAVAESEIQVAPPKEGMAAQNTRNRKQPEKYVPSMQGNKYQAALAQITTSLGSSKTSMAFAMMSIKLMNKVTHQRADVVGMVMAQVLLKAVLKKWGREADESVGKEMKQLHWKNSFKPMHWKSLTADQRKKVLESHIFVEKKRDGVLKTRQVAGGNKQWGYIMKEDASSPTVSSEAVMLTCIVDANENREVAIVDIPNAFVQTVAEDEKDRAFIRICGPLVNSWCLLHLMSMDRNSWEERLEAIAGPMLDCFIWNYGGVATILQEVCQEPEVQGIQAQPCPMILAWPTSSKRGAIDCMFSCGRLQDFASHP
jgi:hypothetical protein